MIFFNMYILGYIRNINIYNYIIIFFFFNTIFNFIIVIIYFIFFNIYILGYIRTINIYIYNINFFILNNFFNFFIVIIYFNSIIWIFFFKTSFYFWTFFKNILKSSPKSKLSFLYLYIEFILFWNKLLVIFFLTDVSNWILFFEVFCLNVQKSFILKL